MRMKGGSRMVFQARLAEGAGTAAAPAGYAALSSEVQWPHFFAWIGIVERQ